MIKEEKNYKPKIVSVTAILEANFLVPTLEDGQAAIQFVKEVIEEIEGVKI